MPVETPDWLSPVPTVPPASSAAIDEREQVSRQRILVHDVPSQRVETVERQAHIDRLPVQEDAQLAP
jgi:hypothetical protein